MAEQTLKEKTAKGLFWGGKSVKHRKTRRKYLHFPHIFAMMITCDILIPCSRY